MRIVDAIEQDRTSFDPTAKNARELVLEGVLEAVADFERSVMSSPARESQWSRSTTITTWPRSRWVS